MMVQIGISLQEQRMVRTRGEVCVCVCVDSHTSGRLPRRNQSISDHLIKAGVYYGPLTGLGGRVGVLLFRVGSS